MLSSVMVVVDAGCHVQKVRTFYLLPCGSLRAGEADDFSFTRRSWMICLHAVCTYF